MAKRDKEGVLILGGVAALILFIGAKGQGDVTAPSKGQQITPTPTLVPSPGNTSTNPGSGLPNVSTSSVPTQVSTFLNNYMSQAVTLSDLAPSPGISPTFILAQAALESDWGRSDIYQNTHNLFAIHADSSWTGPTYTPPGDPNNAAFRVYADDAHSFADYLSFLETNANYKPLWQSGTSDAITWAEIIGTTGYSEDSSYTDSLLGVIGTIQQAVGGGLKGVGMSEAAQSFISDKIEELINEGYPAKQAEAIAYEEARGEGFRV